MRFNQFKGYNILRFRLSILIAATGLICDVHAVNPEKLVGAGVCAECHVSESEAWQKTHHFNTFSELHRRPKAKEIQKRLGLKRIKSESDCMKCHYSVQKVNDKLKAVSGISCESCHGAAKDWIDVHNNFGGPGTTKENETPEHKSERLKATAAAGMIRPGEIYKLASNCFQCHTVPNERLVNLGGHKAGSNFELVSWFHGEVRHNFIDSNGKVNREATSEHKRVLYVVGRILDLEYSFRGVAKATEKASYAVRMAKRAKRAIARVDQINQLKSLPELQSIIVLAKAQKLKLNNGDALTHAADNIAEIARAFAGKYTGNELAEIDTLIPGSDKYKGNPAQ